MNLEREYVDAALEAVHEYQFLLPTEVQRKLNLARSVIATYGIATPDEMRAELGPNWVIARRTRRIVERYGQDVRDVTLQQYNEAERRAIEKRFP